MPDELTANEKSALVFDDVYIHNPYPVSNILLDLTNLNPGINVLVGPNGAGKTTAGLAIQTLLWPTIGAKGEARMPGADLRASIRAGQGQWEFRFSGNKRSELRNGSPSSFTSLPGADTSDRYWIALQNLLLDNGFGFAQAIAGEMAGGYDIGLAKKRLGLPETTGKKLSKPREDAQLRPARKTYIDAKASVASLQSESEGLAALMKRRDEAKAASAKETVIAAAKTFVDAKDRVTALETELAEFPEAVKSMTGTEKQKLESLEADFQKEMKAHVESARRRDQAKLELEACAEQFKSLNLPDGGVAGGVLIEIKNEIAGLGEADRTLLSAKTTLTSADAARAEAKQRVFTSGEAVGLNGETLEQLAKLVADVEKNLGKLEASQTLQSWLSGESVSDTDKLSEAEKVLLDWLGAERATIVSPPQWPLYLAVCAVFVVAGLLQIRGEWWGWPVAVATFIVIWFTSKAPLLSQNQAAEEQKRFPKGIAAPTTWDRETVKAFCQELRSQIASAKVSAQMASNAAVKKPDWERLDIAAKKAENTLNAFKQEHGIQLNTVTLSDAVLFTWCEAYVDLCSREVTCADTRRKYEQATKDRTDALNRVNALLRPYGYEDVASSAQASGKVADLEARSNSYRSTVEKQAGAIRQAHQAANDIATSQTDLEKIELEREALRDRLAPVVPDFEGELSGLVTRALEVRTKYQSASDQLKEAKGALKQASASVPQDSPYRNESIRRLRDELELCEAEATEYEGLANAVTELKTRINEAGKKDDVETALAAVDTIECKLRDELDNRLDLAAGHAFAAFVEEQSRKNDRPDVFTKARDLFATFTNGGYELDFNSEKNTFMARDTAVKTVRTLDQLSSGTRVQLLIAVRMAFIETLETDLKLPVVIDEALANSDAERAKAIIEALVALAKAGRQIFYLTAQAEDVNKWKALTETAGQEINIVNVGAPQEMSAAKQIPSPKEPYELPAVPQPVGISLFEYRKVLNVSGIDPWADGVESVDLALLIDEVNTIYDLRVKGFASWGPVKMMADRPNFDIVKPEVWAKLRARVTVLEDLCCLWRMGRGKPLQYDDVLGNGIVSDKYAEAVHQIAKKYDYCARSIIVELTDNSPRGFQSRVTDKLKDYYIEKGCLDDAMPTDRQAAIDETMDDNREDIATDNLTRDDIEELAGLFDW